MVLRSDIRIGYLSDSLTVKIVGKRDRGNPRLNVKDGAGI